MTGSDPETSLLRTEHLPTAEHLPSTAASIVPLDDRTWNVTAPGENHEIRLELPTGPAFVLDDEGGDLFVLPSDATGRTIAGRETAWVLPADASSAAPSWLVTTQGRLRIEQIGERRVVVIEARSATLTAHRARPHADVQGARFAIDLPGGDLLADAAAGFYWGTMLPSIVERTRAADFADADGYVVSTLASRYSGTYPDVDHEFQIKGRLAWGDDVDLAVVRRMIELQLRMMREDPQQLWRDPCAVQPDGDREYHVRRNSADGTENAVMFLVTGNIEVLESAWLYVARTHDVDWLHGVIGDLEGAASLVEGLVDPLGRLWSDVYYEDQVIKDGRETMAQALAVRSFELLAELQRLVGRNDQADGSAALRDRLAAALAQPLPAGFWDAEAGRFVDWVDRNGRVHDHIHLLANILPPLVGAADPAQTETVRALVDAERDEFQRFPTFLSARIQDYTESEIGDGGPYDLCAAGRYWCWDAAYWRAEGDGGVLAEQLRRVAEEGASSDWLMGERYDMNHVYYTDGTSWHGAAHYYEYPCVFSWVLVHEYLGLRFALDVDLELSPRLTDTGTVTLEQDAYRLSYTSARSGFTVRNLADHERRIRVDLSTLYPDAVGFQIVGSDGTERRSGRYATVVSVPAEGFVVLTPAAHVAPTERHTA